MSITISNKLTWEKAVGIYINQLIDKSISIDDKKDAIQEIMRLAREMDKLQGKEVV